MVAEAINQHSCFSHVLAVQNWKKIESRRMATSFDNMREQQRADGFAAVLAIGTANPSNVVEQSTFPDYFFRVTGLEHETALKEKFRRICENSGNKKRYMCLTEDLLRQYPCLVSFDEPSLNARQKLLVKEVPRLAKEASEKAIKEWGRPISSITHLVFTTTSGVEMPGADYQLTMLLGLRPNVKRVTMYEQGCFAGATMLRVAKDLAENNRSARVLGVCSETSLMFFRAPSKLHFGSLLGPALFGDGASAVIVGADSIEYLEKPLFQMVRAEQVILPNSHRSIGGELLEMGLTFEIGRDVPNLISNNIEECLIEALDPLGISDWNSLFWVAHPGGRAILDQVEAKLKLVPEKLRSSRKVLSEYGNMSSAAVIFVLDEMRKWSAEMGLATTGEGLHWGVLFGFGPGITVETLVLRSMPL